VVPVFVTHKSSQIFTNLFAHETHERTRKKPNRVYPQRRKAARAAKGRSEASNLHKSAQILLPTKHPKPHESFKSPPRRFVG
jgi:hypothetical protein